MDCAVGRLRPVPQAEGEAAKTDIEVFVGFELSRQAGLAAAVNATGWLVNMIAFLLIPSIWSGYLDALAAIASGPHAGRLRADRIGVYALVARRTRQASASDRSNGKPSSRGAHLRGWRPRLKAWWQRVRGWRSTLRQPSSRERS